MVSNQDWLVIRAGKHFRLGAGIDEGREHEMFSALCAFINDHHLSHKPLTVRGLSDWEGFELRNSHFTELGRLVIKEGLTRWLSAIDRGTAPDKSKVLLRTLKKCQDRVEGTLPT